jgi:hypothetical protein
MFSPVLGPTQPPGQWIPTAGSLEIKRQGRETDHLPPYSAEVKKGGGVPPHYYTSSRRSA